MPTSRPRGAFTVAKWSLAFAANGVLLFVIGVSTVRETYREWKVDQEIVALEQKIETFEGKKLGLTELASRMSTDEAVDRQARVQLGLQRPGERVFVVRGIGDDVTGAMAMEFTAEPEGGNPGRWLKHFFPLLSSH